MSQMPQSEFDQNCWQQIDPRPDQQKAENLRVRKWVVAFFIGLPIGILVACLAGTGAAFLPGWALGWVGVGSWLEGK